MLPTTITGSLPRPGWYTENLGSRSFLEAMINNRFREQYTDAVSGYLRDQEIAGLDIVTDGDARFDTDVGGQSWITYPPHLGGLRAQQPRPRRPAREASPFPRGHILHEYLEARVMPTIIGPVGRGDLQYTPILLTAQSLTLKPVKFGTITPELVAFAVQDTHYKTCRSASWRSPMRSNEELSRPRRRRLPGDPDGRAAAPPLGLRGGVDQEINPEFMVEVFNNTVRGLRAKTEVWCHTCWGNPSQQRMFATVQSYKPSLEPTTRSTRTS